MNSPIRTPTETTVPQQIAAVATMRAVHAAFAWFQLREQELRRLQLEIARIPAPPFREAARGEWLREKFHAIGLDTVEVDAVGDVIGILPGEDPGLPAVAVTAR